jgi:hypothetical protein
MEGMNQMLLQAKERFDTLLKRLQAEEAKVAKCVIKLKKFALQVQIVQVLSRQVDAQRGVSKLSKVSHAKERVHFLKCTKMRLMHLPYLSICQIVSTFQSNMNLQSNTS